MQLSLGIFSSVRMMDRFTSILTFRTFPDSVLAFRNKVDVVCDWHHSEHCCADINQHHDEQQITNPQGYSCILQERMS